MKRLYTFLVTWFIRLAVRFARARGRVVHYTHKGQLYMTRYALWGHLTGDCRPEDAERWHSAGEMSYLRVLWVKVRHWLPNLYVHQMHAPDLDPSLHDHPWPWALSWVMLGGYREERLNRVLPGRDLRSARNLNAPALNVLSGHTFHRIAELRPFYHYNGPSVVDWEDYKDGGKYAPLLGTWTLFLAGPRAARKSWGYIVEGRGYVSHQERHEEFDGQELREPGPLKRATGKALDALGASLGLKRRKRCRWIFFSESDNDFRSRMHDFACSIAGCP